MKFNKGLTTSETCEWSTPNWLIEHLKYIGYDLTLDVCATEYNHKCNIYYTKNDNGLIKPWITTGWVWCNPPYGKEIGKWIDKAIYEHTKSKAEIILLVPARTDTIWFQKLIYICEELKFIKGRLNFNNSKNSAPFPSVIAIMKNNNYFNMPKISTIEQFK